MRHVLAILALLLCPARSETVWRHDFRHNAAATHIATDVRITGHARGAGHYTGDGRITFDGHFSPGNSPAIVTIAPQVVFTPSNILTMEIGGLTPGPGTPTDNGYDKLIFTHATAPQVTWGGTLDIVLINGFTPAAGDAFDVFDFNPALDAGTFATISAPALGGGLSWDFSALYSTGTIRVFHGRYQRWALDDLGDIAAPPLGDHDGDGVKNIEEYALALFPVTPGVFAPAASIFAYAEGPRLRLQFWRHIDRDDLTIEVQASPDLATWTTIATSVNSAIFTGPGYISENRAHPLSAPGLVEIRDIQNVPAGARRFLRIKLTLAP